MFLVLIIIIFFIDEIRVINVCLLIINGNEVKMFKIDSKCLSDMADL